jgi:hypothetical protein
MAYEQAPAASGVHAVVGLSGLAVESEGFRLIEEKVVRLELPAELDARNSEILQRDIQLLAEIANRRPESLAHLHNAAVRNDFGEAQRIAGEIGLSEERFVSEGGGIWHVVAGFLAVVAIVVLASESGSPSPTPAPENPPPETTPIPDAGAPSAGAPG